MLTASPVAALGGVRAFDVVDAFPATPEPYAQRIATRAPWFGIEPLRWSMTPKAPARACSLRRNGWMDEAPMGWILDGKPRGYSREADRADRANRLQVQRWAKALSHPDDEEIRLLIVNGIGRGRSRAVSIEAALEEARQTIITHRVRMAA